MKTSELRIGNLLLISGEVKAVTSIGLYSIGWDGQYHTTLPTEMIEPIPLTEDWLAKLGFGKWRNDFYTDGGCDYYFIPSKKEFGLHSEVDGSTWKLRSVEYLHTLMNMFFALNGQELTINQTSTK